MDKKMLSLTGGRLGSGMTMVELVIVIAIIALLVTLALPTFSDYVRKGRRAEAQQLLLNWANNQEIWRATNPTYADSTTVLGVPTHDFFTFTITNVSATSYTLTATASGNQCRDRATQSGASSSSLSCNGDSVSIPSGMVSCGQMTLTQSGAKTQPGCWGRSAGS